MSETKVCAKCKEELPINAFAKANGNYPRSECRQCGKKQAKIREILKKQHQKPDETYTCPVCKRGYENIKFLGKSQRTIKPKKNIIKSLQTSNVTV